MAFNLAVLFIFLVLAVVGLVFMLVLRNKSFKNQVWIARQTGKDPGDVIWFSDRFRVWNRDGAWYIQFKKLKESTRSIEGKYWMKFLNPKTAPKIVSMTEEEWNRRDMRTQLMRGLFLYETNEGEYYPMEIVNRDGGFKFSVLDQDNRQFLISEIKDINDLTRNRKKEMTMLWGIIIGMFAFAIVAIGGMWWTSHMHDANIAQTANLCAQITQTVVQSANSTTYLGQLTGVLGG